jgi:hypothetical protein
MTAGRYVVLYDTTQENRYIPDNGGDSFVLDINGAYGFAENHKRQPNIGTEER